MKSVELLLEKVLWHVVVEPAALKPALIVAVAHEQVDAVRREGAEDDEQDGHFNPARIERNVNIVTP